MIGWLGANFRLLFEFVYEVSDGEMRGVLKLDGVAMIDMTGWSALQLVGYDYVCFFYIHGLN